VRNRRNVKSLLRVYNEKLLKHLNYDQFIVRYRENSKSINILRYKQEDKKFIRLSFNKNDVKSSNAKEASTLS